MAEKKYLNDVGLERVADHVKSRLKTVTTMPASAEIGAVRLYVGKTDDDYIKGHIYEYTIGSGFAGWADITGSGGGSITVDSKLSTTSKNPVQNKVITNELSTKASKDDFVTKIIYIDNVNGNDNNDGTTAEKAIKTVGRAIELSSLTNDLYLYFCSDYTMSEEEYINLGYYNRLTIQSNRRNVYRTINTINFNVEIHECNSVTIQYINFNGIIGDESYDAAAVLSCNGIISLRLLNCTINVKNLNNSGYGEHYNVYLSHCPGIYISNTKFTVNQDSYTIDGNIRLNESKLYIYSTINAFASGANSFIHAGNFSEIYISTGVLDKTTCNTSNKINNNNSVVYLDGKLLNSSLAKIFDTTTEYNVGDIIIYQGRYYICKNQHSGNWNINNFELKDYYADLFKNKATPIEIHENDYNNLSLEDKCDKSKIYFVYGQNSNKFINNNIYLDGGLLYGRNVWTDQINTYYSDDNKQYKLNGTTWELMSWSEEIWFKGYHTWTDGTNIYCSTGYEHYKLNGTTWESIEWTDTNGNILNFEGDNVWTDGTNIYCSCGNELQLKLNGTTWEHINWSGIENNDLYGPYIWHDGNNTYYSVYEGHYKLNGTTWESIQWTDIDGNIIQFYGEDVWTDGTNSYLCYAGAYYYRINSNNITLESVTWSGVDPRTAQNVWTDGVNIYYNDNLWGSGVYKLNNTTWESINIVSYIPNDLFEDLWHDNNNNIFLSLGYGEHYKLEGNIFKKTSIANNYTIYGRYIWYDGDNIYHTRTNLKYKLVNGSWEYITFTGINGDIYPTYIWSDGKNTYYTPSSNSSYKLNGTNWESVTFTGVPGYFNVKCIWNDGVNAYYSYSSYQYKLNGLTWESVTWNGLNGFDGRNVWRDNKDNIYYSKNNQQYILNGTTWTDITWVGFNNIDGSLIWNNQNDIYYAFSYKLINSGYNIYYNNIKCFYDYNLLMLIDGSNASENISFKNLDLTGNLTKNGNEVLDGWHPTNGQISGTSVIFTGCSDNYGYALYCQNRLATASDMVKTGSGNNVTLTYTVEDATSSDVFKLRIIR